MIDRDHKLSITHQASLLNISRGTVYYLPQPVSPADLALMRKLDELHLEHPFMGARMLRDQQAEPLLPAQGMLVRLASRLTILRCVSIVTHKGAPGISCMRWRLGVQINQGED